MKSYSKGKFIAKTMYPLPPVMHAFFLADILSSVTASPGQLVHGKVCSSIGVVCVLHKHVHCRLREITPKFLVMTLSFLFLTNHVISQVHELISLSNES
jgi:hypothetical protein